MTATPGDRCPLCDARALGPTDRVLTYPGGERRRFPLACASCGLLLTGGADGARQALETLGPGPFACLPDAAFGLDVYTLRIAAAGRGLQAIPDGADQARALAKAHSDLAARAVLARPRAQDAKALSLGILCRVEEVDAVLGSLAPYASFAADVTILADGGTAPPRSIAQGGFAPNAIRLAGRPLAGDFAAQRNALQDLAREDWMLQLDADETLAAGLAERLGALAGIAETDGILSVGLSRRNLVDGVASDVHPDVQYRLNRREVRYAGTVHERPERPWQRSFLVPGAGIDHHLTRERVQRRSRAYEAMAPGRGRPQEEEDLLAPYRA